MTLTIVGDGLDVEDRLLSKSAEAKKKQRKEKEVIYISTFVDSLTLLFHPGL